MAKNRIARRELREHVRRSLGEDNDEQVKTASMMRLEKKFNKSIRKLLEVDTTTGLELAEKYNVSGAAISRWRKRLGIKPKKGRPFGSSVKSKRKRSNNNGSDSK